PPAIDQGRDPAHDRRGRSRRGRRPGRGDRAARALEALRLGAPRPRHRRRAGALAPRPLMFVLDASVAFAACASEYGFEEFAGRELVAPPLMWSEARSTIHELAWRGDIDRDDAERTVARLETCPVARKAPASRSRA